MRNPIYLKTSFTAALLSLFILSTATAQKEQPLHVLKVKNFKQAQSIFKHCESAPILISGHRGGMAPGYPENCIESFENTLRHTPAIFEIDPRLTKDSVIVLMHDKTLNRTTTGKGNVSDYTYAELQKIFLKDNQGNITPYKIPTLEEAILWSRGKTVINLDRKDVPLEMMAKLLKKHKFPSHVMLTVHSVEQAKFYHQQSKNLLFSAFMRTPDEFKEYKNSGIPWKHFMAYVGPTMKKEFESMYQEIRSNGVKCMISVSPTFDRLKEADARQKGFIEEIKKQPDVIESDFPEELAKCLLIYQ